MAHLKQEELIRKKLKLDTVPGTERSHNYRQQQRHQTTHDTSWCYSQPRQERNRHDIRIRPQPQPEPNAVVHDDERNEDDVGDSDANGADGSQRAEQCGGDLQQQGSEERERRRQRLEDYLFSGSNASLTPTQTLTPTHNAAGEIDFADLEALEDDPIPTRRNRGFHTR